MSGMKELRVELGWTYGDLAKSAGLHRQTVSRAEDGGLVEPATAKKIAVALGRAHKRVVTVKELELNVW